MASDHEDYWDRHMKIDPKKSWVDNDVVVNAIIVVGAFVSVALLLGLCYWIGMPEVR